VGFIVLLPFLCWGISFQMLSYTYDFINDGKHKNNCKHLVVKKFDQTVRQHHLKQFPPRVTKSRLTDKDKMTSSNINKYMFKSYLNFFKWVADGMQGC
jgi:hypothetical protein